MAVPGGEMERSILLVDSHLVDVLPVPDEHADHVQVAIFACLPDVVEGLLDLVVLTDDEGGPVLTILKERELVLVSLVLDEEVDSIRVAVVGRIMERRPAAIVQSIYVGSLAQEELEAVLAALPAGQVERRAHLLVFRL